MNNNTKAKPEPTEYAKRLYNELNTLGIKCELEKFDGYKHIDIVITSAFLNIEIDGSHHNLDRTQANSDINRFYFSYIKGYNTIRIPNSLLREEADIKNTARLIKKMIQEKPKLYNQKAINTITKKETQKYQIGIAILTILLIVATIL